MFAGTSGHTQRFWPPRGAPFKDVMSPLNKVRKQFSKYGIGYYIVLTQDAHDSEFVAESDCRRDFITGFTGSAGTAIIGKDWAELSTDGRYFLQAEQQLGPEWTLRKEGVEEYWVDSLCERANREGKNIGVDPKFINYSLVEKLKAKLHSAELVAVDENLIDQVWADKPAESTVPLLKLPLKYTGETAEDKIERVRKALKDNEASAICLSALDEIAWLFNVRGGDIPFNPVFKSYALVTLSSVKVFVDRKKASHIDLPAEILPYEEIWDVLGKYEKPIWIPTGGSWQLMKVAGYPEITYASPVSTFKAVKTPEEIQGARDAQFKCGLSFVRLFAWLDRNIDSREITEWDAAQKLLSIRNELPEFQGLSYGSISSVGPNAAIIHYEPGPDTKYVITRSEPYLLDAGCQFLHGTTDTTRSVHFGNADKEVVKAYTLVLKGHIALSKVRFPAGTTGSTLDVLARQYLWDYGLNYRHGTGHGVGSFLNVHEQPVGFTGDAYGRCPFSTGMITSNEPGCYIDNKFGVRIESMLVVQPAKTECNYDNVQYYEFEYITLVPLALNLIDKSLLSVDEISWINTYSTRVRESLGSHLSTQDKVWLIKNTYHI